MFENGSPVLVKGNLLGIVLSSWLWTMRDTRKFLYRVVVDSKDAQYRIINNDIDQTKSFGLFTEDYNTLLYTSEQIGVLEIFEDDLKLFTADYLEKCANCSMFDDKNNMFLDFGPTYLCNECHRADLDKEE